MHLDCVSKLTSWEPPRVGVNSSTHPKRALLHSTAWDKPHPETNFSGKNLGM